MPLPSARSNHCDTSLWRPLYHVAPPYGLLNDPNGFSYFAGQYWLYFQWNPTGCEHTNKHWGLMTSTDLVHWEQQPFKMAPTHWFDKDGCYSGTGLVEKETLSLFYTGNVRHGEARESYQCLVTTKDGQHYEHQGPLWSEQLNGFTGHVRDPKVFIVNGQRRMWLAAQRADLLGGVAVLNEQENGQWQLQGHYQRPIGWAHKQLGYMWECPDRLVFDGQTLLVCCVQGIHTPDSEYTTTNLSGYFTVEEAPNGTVHFTSDYRLLDHGFDFYAPQTTVDARGRVILVGWMGLPDSPEQPTAIHEGWCEQLTLPRECQWQGQRLLQRPLPEQLSAFSAPTATVNLSSESTLFSCTDACLIELEQLSGIGQLRLGSNQEQLVIRWDGKKTISVDRSQVCVQGTDALRHYTSDQVIEQFQLFVDRSSFELFINGGEAVLSGRMFFNTEIDSATVNATSAQLQVRLLTQPCINLLTQEQCCE